jgi:hypothetical protein
VLWITEKKNNNKGLARTCGRLWLLDHVVPRRVVKLTDRVRVMSVRQPLTAAAGQMTSNCRTTLEAYRETHRKVRSDTISRSVEPSRYHDGDKARFGSSQALKAVVFGGGMTKGLCSPHRIPTVHCHLVDRPEIVTNRQRRASASLSKCAANSQHRGTPWTRSYPRGCSFRLQWFRESDRAEAGCVLFDGSTVELIAIMCARRPRVIAPRRGDRDIRCTLDRLLVRVGWR